MTVKKRLWVFDLLLILTLIMGAYFRFSGLRWDDFTYMHPDERFMIWVTSDIAPVSSVGEYFNTSVSSLNPNNRGHGFFVYGTFPLFLTRYAVTLLSENSTWEQIALFGRSLSAVFDLLTVLLVYLVAARLYSRKVAILSAVFLSAAVLPIQLSHFYKEDTFLNFFMLLAIYFAARIVTALFQSPEPGLQEKDKSEEYEISAENSRSNGGNLSDLFKNQWPWFLGFGLALGLAVASKLNAAPVAIVLPVAVAIRLYKAPLSGETRFTQRRLAIAFALISLSAITSLAVFRLAQPYAFSGPGILGIAPNPQWVANITEQRNQAAGDVDYPPSLQWARRPAWFAVQNIVLWGLGLPLGLLAFAGFLWTGLRILRGEWQKHIFLWSWAFLYLLWQSSQFNPTMRYLLPVYPMLVIFAAWAVVQLGDEINVQVNTAGRLRLWMSAIFTYVVIVLTVVYAFAFSRVYTQPFTRAEASRWIYQNIPGPITLEIKTSEGIYNQPLSFPYDFEIRPDVPYFATFSPKVSGELSQIRLAEVIDREVLPGEKSLLFSLSTTPGSPESLAASSLSIDFSDLVDQEPKPFSVTFNSILPLAAGQTYFLNIQLSPGEDPLQVDGSAELLLETGAEQIAVPLSLSQATLYADTPLSLGFMPQTDGFFREITLFIAYPFRASVSEKTLTFEVAETPDSSSALARVSLTGKFDGNEEIEPEGYLLALSRSVQVEANHNYTLIVRLANDLGAINLRGAAVSNEGEWDDGLPLRLDGYDGFGGIYQRDLNLNMYWDDNQAKLERFQRILEKADYLFISSSRQWGTLPRLPERFPLVTEYYRELIGCPLEQSVEWCYNVAQPGTFEGKLGFQLIKVFESPPQVGAQRINDQFAEEAFTVYDHPKVFIFKKDATYSSENVTSILASVDLAHIVRVTPKRASSHPMDLMLPDARLMEQRSGGTWSDLFDSNGLLNKNPWLGVVAWYLSVMLLGLIVFPLVRLALPGLADRGYPFTRTIGLLSLTYLVWLAGSAGLPFNSLTILIACAVLIVLSLIVFLRQREELRIEWRERRNYYLLVELLGLVSFVLMLYIRWSNPDLWHPWKGGEKPMDFSYFNAILKSTTFPPYDPWFAGGYINYYYYGFLFVGVLVKLLGIVPAVAYNMILPTLFSLLLLGAFSVGWNLMIRQGASTSAEMPSGETKHKLFNRLRELLSRVQTIVALAAALGVAFLGNLGIVRMIFRGYQMLAAPGGAIDDAGFFSRIIWAFQGLMRVLSGASLPYGVADWYWNPSRVIPPLGDVEPITEFPFFTVLYADLHAHLIALPVTLLALGWSLSVILRKGGWQRLSEVFASLLLGGLVIGSLRPMNTWDFPTYLVLGLLGVVYAFWRYTPDTLLRKIPGLKGLSGAGLRMTGTVGAALLLLALSFLMYQPFAYWYGQGYNAVDWWQGSRTPIWSYFTHWGLFLFLIVSWLVYESLDWMASTPVSALKKLEPYRQVIWGGLAILVLLTVALALRVPILENLPIGKGVQVAWITIPAAAWSALLLFKPTLSDAKRIVLFLVGTGFVLTLVVEIIVLRGDIGRMNTVFKFYLQVWTLFAVSAAASLGWLIHNWSKWSLNLRTIWQIILTALVAGAALYPLLGSTAKMKDRIVEQAPSSLNGMSFMQYGTYFDQGAEMDLSQDLEAIRWMQENVYGSPVILEGNTVEYHWGSRFTIYTGLPGVVGWNWHQRQQRGNVVSADWVTDRVAEVAQFYLTENINEAIRMLGKYDVEYFVVGQLERAYYPGIGLEKFAAYDGVYWENVFQTGETSVYRVISP